MKRISKDTISVFSFVSTLQFIAIFVNRVYGTGRLLTRYGPCNLNEIPWLKEIIASIVVGLLCGCIGYILDKVEKAQGKVTHIPRIKFKKTSQRYCSLLHCSLSLFLYSSSVSIMNIYRIFRICSKRLFGNIVQHISLG